MGGYKIFNRNNSYTNTLYNIRMNEFENIIGKKLIKVNYKYKYEGYEDYSENYKANFEYLPFGGLHIKLSNNQAYCIADYNNTKLDTASVGIKRISGKQTDLTESPIPERINEKWAEYIGEEIIGLKIYVNKEKWANYNNEFYQESIQLNFNHGKSIYYLCGDVDYYNESLNKYDLITGRDCGIIFFNEKAFNEYLLDKVERIENYGLQHNV